MLKKISISVLMLCNPLHSVTVPSLPAMPTKAELAAIEAIKKYETVPAGILANTARIQAVGSLEDLTEGPFAQEVITAFETLQEEKGIFKGMILHPTPKQTATNVSTGTISLLSTLAEALQLLAAITPGDASPTHALPKPAPGQSALFADIRKGTHLKPTTQEKRTPTPTAHDAHLAAIRAGIALKHVTSAPKEPSVPEETKPSSNMLDQLAEMMAKHTPAESESLYAQYESWGPSINGYKAINKNDFPESIQKLEELIESNDEWGDFTPQQSSSLKSFNDLFKKEQELKELLQNIKEQFSALFDDPESEESNTQFIIDKEEFQSQLSEIIKDIKLPEQLQEIVTEIEALLALQNLKDYEATVESPSTAQ